MGETIRPLKREKKNKNTARRVTIAMAAILALLMILTGTMAWQSISQVALNATDGAPLGPAGGRLHDDFEWMGSNPFTPTRKAKEWSVGETVDKDIYVENFEDADKGRPIFVRVRLYEYMEIGEGARLSPSSNPVEQAAYEARKASSLIAGADRDNFATWSKRLPENVTDKNSDEFRKYWAWNQVGGNKVYMPTFNKDNMSKESDVKGAGQYPLNMGTGELQNDTRIDPLSLFGLGNPTGNEYAVDAGKHTYWNAGDKHQARVKFYDHYAGLHGKETTLTEHTAKNTLNANNMTMAEWIAAGSTPGRHWVLDEDGWAYWAESLQAGTATGLLLSGYKMKKEADDEWFYGIHVEAEMATADSWQEDADDLGFYHVDADQPSANAKALLELITAEGVVITGSPSGAVSLASGEEITLAAMMHTKNHSTGTYTWKVVDLSVLEVVSENANVLKVKPKAVGTTDVEVEVKIGSQTFTNKVTIEVVK